jgi:hypothetical protein
MRLSPAYLTSRVRHYGYGRVVSDVAKRTGIPIGLAFAFTHMTKRLASPIDWVRRSRVGFLKNSEWANAMPKEGAWRVYTPGAVPGALEIAAACRAFAEPLQPSILGTGATYVDLLCVDGPRPSHENSSPYNIDFVPGLLDFALSDPIVHAATGYLGAIPVLGGITLYASAPNNTLKGSQSYHRDEVDSRIFKVLVAVNDIEPETGPFTFIPANKTRQLQRSIGYKRGRIADERVFSVLDPRDQIAFTGPAGSVLFCDSSRCLHYGSRNNRKMRLLLEVLYYSAFHQAENSRRFSKQIYSADRFRDPLRQALLKG